MRAIPVGVLAGVLSLGGCSLQGPLNAPDTTQAIAGHPAPDFSGTDLDGRPIHLSDYRGHPLLVSFWASWCGPCRAEQPGLNRVAADLTPKGLAIVGIDVRDEADQARIFRNEMRMPYPSLYDQAGRLEYAYQIDAPPSTVLIGSDGVIREKIVGAISEADLRAAIRRDLHLAA